MGVIRRRFTPEDRAASVYQYVPFAVPAGTEAVTVTVGYDRPGGNVIDLGLEAPDRFGGWSGGERSALTVTRAWATPGYVPGELAGEWRVILGLYRVGAGGVDVDVDVTTSAAPVAPPPSAPPPPRPARPPRRPLPAAPGREWLACDFHSHTVHSDGGLEVAELAVLAAAQGLDVLAVTDHNTVSHHAFLAAAGHHAGVLLLPGQELTTDTGHANCFGDVGWIDFRRPAGEWLADAERRGALLSVNHPWAPGDSAWRRTLSPKAPAVEAWHSTWDLRAPEPLDEWAEHGAVPIGGSDFHRHGAPAKRSGAEARGYGARTVPGEPTTWVEAEDRSTAAVLDAIRAGRVSISASPTSPVLLRHDGELVAVGADGCTRHTNEHATWLAAGGRVAAMCV